VWVCIESKMSNRGDLCTYLMFKKDEQGEEYNYKRSLSEWDKMTSEQQKKCLEEYTSVPFWRMTPYAKKGVLDERVAVLSVTPSKVYYIRFINGQQQMAVVFVWNYPAIYEKYTQLSQFNVESMEDAWQKGKAIL